MYKKNWGYKKKTRLKRKNEKPFFKLIILSSDDMNRFEEKESKKERQVVQNSWFDWYIWLINYIPSPIKSIK